MRSTARGDTWFCCAGKAGVRLSRTTRRKSIRNFMECPFWNPLGAVGEGLPAGAEAFSSRKASSKDKPGVKAGCGRVLASELANGNSRPARLWAGALRHRARLGRKAGEGGCRGDACVAHDAGWFAGHEWRPTAHRRV